MNGHDPGVPPAEGDHRVAVVSDGSDFHRDPHAPSVLTDLLATAAWLRERAGMAATALLVTADNAEELIVGLRRVAPDLSGVYLVHTDPDRALAAQTALAETLPVVTERVATAVALTAATLTMLARAGVSPAAGRVVIAGAERNPVVAALANAAGIGEIDSWGLDEDAHDVALRTVPGRGAVVVDLLDAAAHRRRLDSLAVTPPVIAVDEPGVALLALPDLLTAARISGRPPGRAECLACAYALVGRTGSDQVLPGLPDAGPLDPAFAAAVPMPAGVKAAAGYPLDP